MTVTDLHPVAAPEHTWKPIDVVHAAANPPEPPTIGQLLYPAKRTLLSGERDSMKTWLALILVVAEIQAGYPVAWADLDAMGAGAILERLRLLGLTDEQISAKFLYYAPAERLIGTALNEVAAQLAEVGARMFIADAFNPFLSLHGLDPNSTVDVETFWREVADPICRAGAAPVMLDHVVKNAQNRGHYAIGSERKASGAIVHLGTRIVTPFGRGRVGASVLECHRDREGYLPKPKIGLLQLTANDGHNVTFTLKADTPGSSGAFRPTRLMERASEYLQLQHESVAKNHIITSIPGDDKAIRAALDILITEGHAAAHDGPRKAILIEHVRPYREADEPEDDLGGDLGATSVNGGTWHPSLTSVDRVPLGTEHRGRSEFGETTSTTSVETDSDSPDLAYLESLEPEPSDDIDWRESS